MVYYYCIKIYSYEFVQSENFWNTNSFISVDYHKKLVQLSEEADKVLKERNIQSGQIFKRNEYA